MNFVESIQKKPKHIRVKIFLILMTIAFLLVFIVWLNSIKNNFNESGEKKEVKTSEDNYKIKLPTIYESLSAGIKDFFEPQKIKIK